MLDQMPSDNISSFQDEVQILTFLASQPSSEEILALRPSPMLQARISELLDRNKSKPLDRDCEVELDRYLLLEHWVRLAKANSYQRIHSIP